MNWRIGTVRIPEERGLTVSREVPLIVFRFVESCGRNHFRQAIPIPRILESYSDFANRLPRGRTSAGNESVVDLVITNNQVRAIVGGLDVYEIKIKFALLKKKKGGTIKAYCADSINSVMSLLQVRFEQSVMADLSRQKEGLFPTPGEIKLDCDCPDWAGMCKHVATVLYVKSSPFDQSRSNGLFFRVLSRSGNAVCVCSSSASQGGARPTAQRFHCPPRVR